MRWLLGLLDCPMTLLEWLWRYAFGDGPRDPGRDADGNVIDRGLERHRAKQARERAAARRRIAERAAAAKREDRP